MKWIYELLINVIPVSDDNKKHLPHSRYKRLCLVSVALPCPEASNGLEGWIERALTRPVGGPIPWDYHPLVAYQY